MLSVMREPIAGMDADLAALTAMLRRQRERALAEDEEDLRTERNPYMREVLQRSIEELRAELARMNEDRTDADQPAPKR